MFGKASTGAIELSALSASGSDGFTIEGAARNDDAGWSVAGAGDVNGDGRADVIVGAPEADNNGRGGSGSAYVLLVDATPPQTTIDSGPSGPTDDSTPTFAFSANEPGSTFECSIDDGPYEACESDAPLDALSDGTHTFSVRAVDAAGNADASPASVTFTVDTVAPETTITGGPADGSATNDSTPTFEFASNEPGSTFECKIDGGAFAPCASGAPLDALSDGTHTIAVRAIDAAGNPDASPATRTFTVDTVAPTSTTLSALPASPPTFGQPVTFTATVSPASAGTVAFFDGGAPIAGCGAVALGSASTAVCTTSSLAAGSHTITARYGGDPGHAPSTSAGIAYVVQAPATYANEVGADGPLAWYRLGESSAQPLTDSSGNAKHGTCVNGVTFGLPGAVGGTNTARGFDGRAAYCYANGITAPTAAYTIEGWMKLSAPKAGTIAEHGSSGSIYVTTSGYCMKNAWEGMCWASAPTVGVWHHVVASWSASDKVAKLYVDGVLRMSAANGAKPSGSSTFYVGYGQNAPWFTGSLDEVAYYPSRLSDARVAAHYHAGCGC